MLLEDSVAVVGVGVAGVGIGLTALTGNPAFDACGSIAVGGMMGAVACFIIARARVSNTNERARARSRARARARMPCACPRRT